MWDTVSLPASIGRYLKLATPLQIQVLLWLAAAGRGQADAHSCAAALGGKVRAEDCEEALRYWVSEGLLTVLSAGTPATPSKTPAAALSPAKAVVKPAFGVKPQMNEVVARQKSNGEFAYLLDDAACRLGKPLSPGHMETLLYLYDDAGLPAAVILMVIAYAVANGKGNMRYIEKTALNWAERGIDNIAKAVEYLCRLARIERAWDQLSRWLDLAHDPTVTQKEQAEKWLYQWNLSEELVRLAYERCMEKTGKFQSGYMDKVLESWHLEGLDTPEKAAASYGGKGAKKAASSASSV